MEGSDEKDTKSPRGRRQALSQAEETSVWDMQLNERLTESGGVSACGSAGKMQGAGCAAGTWGCRA